MRFPERRQLIMKRSIALGHCVCNPKQPCPCNTLREKDLCPCAGERPDPPKEAIRLTQHVRKAGCASKIGQADLNRVLKKLPVYDDPNVIVGVAAGDDAGIYRIDGDYNLVQTVDVFSPVVDDPYTFGQICAANSVSDVYAMGGRPICALSIIGFPIEELPHEVMADILRGGLDTMREAGVSVIGGHSINDEEIKGGFAVTGLIEKSGGITNAGANPGDRLALTKPLGTGLISFASQIGRASDEAVELIGKSMAALNKDAAELMVEHGATACTDVTGFSLLGHLSRIAQESGVSARIDLANVPVFAEALACAEEEIIPGAVERNRESFGEEIVTVGAGPEEWLAVLFDAQTSGGLLVALPDGLAEPYIEAMKARGHAATAIIGIIVAKEDYLVQVALNEPKIQIGTANLREPIEHKAVAEDACCANSLGEAACCASSSVETSCCANPPTEAACCAEAPSVSPMTRSKRSPAMTENTTQAGTGHPTAKAFVDFMKAANAPGAVEAKTKKFLAIALSISQKCDPCLKLHIEGALSQGISWDEIDEVAWITISFCGAPAKMFYDEIKREMRTK